MSAPSEKLPENPSLEQLRKQAKELRDSGACPDLASAQRALARQYGFTSWSQMKASVEAELLRRLMKKEDRDGVRKLLHSNGKLASITFPEGDTPLHFAAQINDPDLVEILVQAGAPLEPRYAHSAHTALSWAITVEAMEAARKLVELGCKPDLFCAAGLGMMSALRSFWISEKLQPHPSSTGSSRYSKDGNRLPCPPSNDLDQVSDALYIACRTNQAEAARWLLDHGADPNWRGYCGATCLAWAEFADNAELASLLRERGGSDELVDDEFRATPRAFGVIVPAAWGFPRRLWLRLSREPSLANARSELGTPLHAAAFNGQVLAAQVLLGFGADKTSLSADGWTPAQVAERRGHKDLATLLA